MKCPKCAAKIKKGGTSRYWCSGCRRWWRIQLLSTRIPPMDVDVMDWLE